ncbi:MAG: hypothetical protein C3F11_02275 [Methylocystaceae bacterium]|nr:MAG: hypothetical protein C3F11_02275 [Methylocystaceae bacterium]
MGNGWPTVRTSAREALVRIVACLLLLQATVFTTAQSAHGFLAGDGAIGVASAPGEFCEADDKAPQHHRHHHDRHCALCIVGNRDVPFHAIALTATIVALALQQPDAASAPFFHDEPASSPAGWSSSWSSRAPPLG